MRDLQEMIGADLRWIQVSRRPLIYELRAGAAREALVATQEWIPRAPVLGRWAGGYFYFSLKRAPWSFLRPRYVILIQGGTPTEPNTFAATFTSRPSMLTLPNGRAFRWRWSGRWLPDKLWVDEAGNELVRFRLFREHGRVEVQPQVAHLPELPLPLLLGKYMITLDELADN
jgi:hypothetical protein